MCLRSAHLTRYSFGCIYATLSGGKKRKVGKTLSCCMLSKEITLFYMVSQQGEESKLATSSPPAAWRTGADKRRIRVRSAVHHLGGTTKNAAAHQGRDGKRFSADLQCMRAIKLQFIEPRFNFCTCFSSFSAPQTLHKRNVMQQILVVG